MGIDIDKIRLEYTDVSGRGKEIRAMTGQNFNCVEFTMRDDVPQPITWSPNKPIYICSEPWIQFKPEEWSDMLDAIFKEMVDLWNEKHGRITNNDNAKERT